MLNTKTIDRRLKVVNDEWPSLLFRVSGRSCPIKLDIHGLQG